MNTNEIKKLIDAFYNGETSVEEEQLLLNYFNGGDIAEELLEEKEIFLHMYNAEPADVPVGLESKLNNLIDELASKETVKVELKPQSNKRQMWVKIGSIAAGVALLITAGVYFNKKADPVTPPLAQGQTETINAEDEQKIKEAQEALVLLSSKFNEGMDQLAVVETNLDKTNEIINKTFNRKKDKEL